jgi:RecB family exonuclease
MISRRLAQLQEIASAYPLHRKVLVTRSYAIGHQWLERLTRERGFAANFEIATPHSLAERHSRLSLRKKKISAITNEEAYWLVYRLMRNMATELTQPYVPLTMLSPSVVRCFHNAVGELRHALVPSERVTPERFENTAKGDYIGKLLERYERYLAYHRLADEVELRLYVEPDPRTETVYLVDRHVQLSAAEQEMLRIITGGRWHVWETDAPFTSEGAGFPAAEAEFYHALGPVAEVREVFRRLAARRIPLDQVEVIVSDEDVYTLAMYTTAMQHGIPCTFSGGIPIDYTLTGQAARLYLAWIDSGYHLEPILQALKQGILRPHTAEAVTTGSLIRILEKSGIGWGRERYELLWRMPAPSPAADATASETDLDATPAVRLADWFHHIFAVLPARDEEWTPSAVMKGFEILLESIPVRDDNEAQAQAGLHHLAETLRCAEIETMDRAMAVRYIREMTERMTFGASGIPSEGKLHVSTLRDGGQSGRPYTFLIGMDEQGWAIPANQDPILLDEERLRIDSRLGTAKERAEHEEQARNERLGSIRGRCTMSFSSFRVADKQERNAAFELLVCYRQQSGNLSAGYEELLHALPPAAGVLHSAELIVIDSQEVWLKALIDRQRNIRRGLQEVLASYPALGEGTAAQRSRSDSVIGKYDGVFDPSGHDPVPAATSVSKLELFARCPLQYFFHEILRVRPKETAEFDRSRWLDAAQRGTLLHAIFQKYWTETNERGGHDRSRLQRITEECLQEAREQIPAPSEHVMLKECEQIRRDTEIFWKGELVRSSRPRFLELELHRAEEPFAARLGDGLTLPLRGYVDRVDELAPHTYKILDYKTGSSRKYREDGYFAGGTQLQHAVYAAAVEQWLHESGLDPEAKVVESGYYFPTYRGQGHEITRDQNRREDTSRLVGSMLEAMRQGLFPPTQDSRQCSWCDYQAVCGRHAEYMKEKRKEPGNGARLFPLLEVESYA